MACPFCNLPEEGILLQNRFWVAIFDKFPVNEGHTLIIPKRHLKSLFDLSEEERFSFWEILDGVKNFLDKNYTPDGYNIGVNLGEAAGQTIEHLHIHFIPRYLGDEDDPTGGVRGVICSKKNYKKGKGQ